MNKYYFILLSIGLSTSAISQTWELGLFAGGAVYNGDIDVTVNNFLPQTRTVVGLFADYHFNRTWSLRGEIAYTQLYADEKKYPSSAYRQSRGYSFQTPLAELAILPEWSPFHIGNVHFFVFGGLSLPYFNPNTNFNEPPIGDSTTPTDKLLADKQQQKPHLSLAIPAGGGVKWVISEQFVIGAELGARKTFTDYIDGISLVASPKSKDYYFFGGVTFSFLMGSNGSEGNGKGNAKFSYEGGVKCPHF